MNYDPSPFVESECFPCGGDAKSHRKCQEKRLRRQKPSKVEQSLHSRSLHLGSLAFNTQQWSKRYLLKIYHSRCYWLVKKYMININYNRPICQILWIFIKSLSFYATFNQEIFFFYKISNQQIACHCATFFVGCYNENRLRWGKLPTIINTLASSILAICKRLFLFPSFHFHFAHSYVAHTPCGTHDLCCQLSTGYM